MIHCADRANAQRIRMPDAVRAELYVTPAIFMEVDMRGGAPPRMKIAHSGGLMAIFMEVLLWQQCF
jgi:hypothetical protein